MLNIYYTFNVIGGLQISVRENQRGNREWTIQRHWQHRAQYTVQTSKTIKHKRLATRNLPKCFG